MPGLIMLERKLRFVGDLPVTCPAGRQVGEMLQGSAVRCQITHSELATATDPAGLSAFCCGDYTTCPVWRGEREAAWERKRALSDVIAREDHDNRHHKKRGMVSEDVRARVRAQVEEHRRDPEAQVEAQRQAYEAAKRRRGLV